MTPSLPTVLVPGLLCTPRVYSDQLSSLWQLGPVTVADHRRDDRIADIAARLLTNAPPRFALAGLSMGGYVALEVMRQAPGRVARLVLLCTSARPDTPEQVARRQGQIEKARAGGLDEVVGQLFPSFMRADQPDSAAWRRVVDAMAHDTGPEAFVRQQTAILNRVDSRPGLKAIACPTLVVAAREDGAMSADAATELASGIAGARLVTLDDCGHLCTLERPEAVAREMASFLAA
jgi:pimeloyl-ACP methyl ester carboxylesterase